jgi:hypothetical protein
MEMQEHPGIKHAYSAQRELFIMALHGGLNPRPVAQLERYFLFNLEINIGANHPAAAPNNESNIIPRG